MEKSVEKSGHSEISKREFNPQQSIASNISINPYGHHQNNKGRRYQKNQVNASNAPSHQPDTTLTSNDKLLKAYRPRAKKYNQSVIKQEPPMIQSNDLAQDHLPVAQSKLHGSFEKPEPKRFLDSAEAATKDSQNRAPDSNQGIPVNRLSQTAGAPTTADDIVNVGNATASHLGVATAASNERNGQHN